MEFITTVYNIALAVLAFFMLIMLFLIFKQKNLMLRLQCVNVFNTFIIMFISVYFYASKKPEYLDIAILYALLSYGGILAFGKFFKLNITQNK